MKWLQRVCGLVGRHAPLIGFLACGNAVPQVAKGPHPQSGGVWPLPVDTRPPLPAVQVITERPHSDCDWLDGEWVWQRNAWTWREGGWVRVNEDCYYAESVLTWQGGPGSGGVLYYTPSQWYRRTSAELCGAALVCSP